MEEKDFKALIDKIKGEMPEVIKAEMEKNGLKMEDIQKAFDEKTISKTDFDSFKTAVDAFIAEQKDKNREQKSEFKTFDQQIKSALKDGDVLNKVKNLKAGFETIEIKQVADMGTGNIGTVATSPMFTYELMPGITGAPKNKPALLDIVDSAIIDGSRVLYSERYAEEGTTGTTAEANAKNQIDANWRTVSVELKKITNYWKFPTEVLEDAAQVVADMKQHAQELIYVVADTQVLSGNNVGANLKGITGFAPGFTAPAELANAIETPNTYDAIVAAATQIAKANFNATHAFMSLGDATKMKLTKDLDGNYILPPFITADGMTVDGIKLIASNQIPAGKLLVGDMSKSHVRAKSMKFDMGLDGNDFTNNMRTMICEVRMLHFIKTNEVNAFVYDDISDIISQIATT